MPCAPSVENLVTSSTNIWAYTSRMVLLAPSLCRLIPCVYQKKICLKISFFSFVNTGKNNKSTFQVWTLVNLLNDSPHFVCTPLISHRALVDLSNTCDKQVHVSLFLCVSMENINSFIITLCSFYSRLTVANKMPIFIKWKCDCLRYMTHVIDIVAEAKVFLWFAQKKQNKNKQQNKTLSQCYLCNGVEDQINNRYACPHFKLKNSETMNWESRISYVIFIRGILQCQSVLKSKWFTISDQNCVVSF